MTQIETIAAVAGWEDRFAKGVCRDIERYRPSCLIIFAFEEYLEETAQSRKVVCDFAEQRNVDCIEVRLTSNAVELWKRIGFTFSENRRIGKSVMVDITTMPREVIWWTFSTLVSAGCNVQYVYYRPEGYASDWVSRDTDQPRLVYQHSGISEFGKKTCLLLVTGFDSDRAAQLIQFFDPDEVIVGLQTGHQYENLVKNVEKNKQFRDRVARISFFDLDAYSPDHGLPEIEAAVAPQLGNSNLVAASLGPKPSAIALYRFQKKNPEVALAYAPSRQFNMKYSFGIGEALAGTL